MAKTTQGTFGRAPGQNDWAWIAITTNPPGVSDVRLPPVPEPRGSQVHVTFGTKAEADKALRLCEGMGADKLAEQIEIWRGEGKQIIGPYPTRG